MVGSECVVELSIEERWGVRQHASMKKNINLHQMPLVHIFCWEKEVQCEVSNHRSMHTISYRRSQFRLPEVASLSETSDSVLEPENRLLAKWQGCRAGRPAASVTWTVCLGPTASHWF
jgi:hypothetical protein